MYLDFAKELAVKAGDFLKERYNEEFNVSKKGIKDLVTQVDYECEKMILDEIKSNFPEHSILSEEEGFIDKKSKYKWIIDPLDGTVNFSRKIPLFGVIITLTEDDQTIVGVINLPMISELYYCQKDKGAYLNGKKLNVSTTDNLNSAIIGLGDFNIGLSESVRNEDNRILTDVIKRFSYKTMRTKIFGAACVDMTSIVSGRTDALFYAFSNPWDVLAAELMIREAGGAVSNYEELTVYSNENLKAIILDELKREE